MRRTILECEMCSNTIPEDDLIIDEDAAIQSRDNWVSFWICVGDEREQLAFCSPECMVKYFYEDD